MNKDYKVVNNKGERITVSILGFFKVNELDKEYAMYSIVDDNPENKNGAVILGEVIRENNEVKILDILEEEIDLVIATYNEIANQIGEKNNGQKNNNNS